jgi:hypothetical protein
MTKIQDSTASFEMLAKNGLYQVGQDWFNHKVNALKAATITKQDVKWYFCDEVWNNLNWKHDDGLPLTHWYTERVKQLREKYDYLILSFSGGADSQNILETFLQSNTKLDEVWVDWPLHYTQDLPANTFDRSASNMPSEWKYSIKPALDDLSRRNPDCKITITDSTAPLEDEDQEDSLEVSQYGYYATIKRWRCLDNIVKERSSKYKKVGIVMGVDKPQFVIVKNVLCAYFTDEVLQYKSDSIGDADRNVEFFYWAPELPELARSQTHAILNYLRKNPDFAEQTFHGKIENSQVTPISSDFTKTATVTRDTLNYSIYPHWNPSTFQTHKPENYIYHNEIYDWLKNKFAISRALQSHRAVLDNTLLGIDERFFKMNPKTQKMSNYKACHTRFYPVGTLRDLDLAINKL